MQKITRITALAILLIGVLSGCATKPYLDPVIQAQAPELVVIANRPVGDGYYALLEKIDGHWKVILIQETPFSRRNNNNQEILFVNHKLRSIAPSFDPEMYFGEGTDCVPMAQLRYRLRYWLCKSHFSSINIAGSVGENIVSCALTFCLAAGTKEELDRDKIQEVVIDSDLINIVKKKIANKDSNNEALKLLSDSMNKTLNEIKEIQNDNLNQYKSKEN